MSSCLFVCPVSIFLGLTLKQNICDEHLFKEGLASKIRLFGLLSLSNVFFFQIAFFVLQLQTTLVYTKVMRNSDNA